MGGAWIAGFAFCVLGLALPGIAIQRLLRLPIDPALVLPLGLAAAAGAQAAGLATGWLPLTPILLLAVGLGLLRPGPWRRAAGPSPASALGVALTLGVLLAVPQFGWSRVDPQGQFLLDPLVPSDTAFHVGLARELTFAWPPQVPGIAGLALSYHLGPDLVRAVALAWAGLDPYDSIARLEPVLGALGLGLVLGGLAHRLWPGTAVAALAPWTLLLGDLAWMLAPDPANTWWCDLLRGNLLVSLAVANPVVSGLTLVGAALLGLDRHLASEGRGHLVLAAALALALPHFKVFLGAHLLLGLGVAALGSSRPAWPAYAIVMLPAALSTAGLALGGTGAVAVGWAPGDLARITREVLGLAPLGSAGLAGWTLGWVPLSLGARALGVPLALRTLGSGGLGATLATLALSGWPLGLLFRVAAPETMPGQAAVNDAAYLVEQSGPLLWLFAIAAAIHARPRLRPALALAALLSLPTTGQFVARRVNSEPDPIPAPMVRAAHALAAASRPGDVVIQRPGARYPPLPVILAGRRVAFERFTPWLTQFGPRALLDQRHEQVHRFFRTSDAAEARAIARDLGARFVCLYGADRVRFPPRDLFREPPVHAEAGAACHRLDDALR